MDGGFEVADERSEAPAEGSGETSPWAGKSRLILALAGALILAGGSAGAAYFVGVMRSTNAAQETGATEEAALPAEAHYVSLGPPMTVNLGEEEDARFLQVTLEAMTRDAETASAIEKHLPLIRNDVLLIFSAADAEQIRNREGKESIRQSILAGLQKALAENGSEGTVEAIYFTSFVMQ
jgi:flagellar FliL protein